VLQKDNFVFCLHGVWLPFDDGSYERLANYKSNLSYLEAQLNENIIYPNFILGDFNASLSRQEPTRFDKQLKSFILNKKLHSSYEMFNENIDEFTYKKGDYTSRIDHILIDNKAYNLIKDTIILDDQLDLSDHKPIAALVQIIQQDKTSHKNNNLKKFHKFDWKNEIFREFYKTEIDEHTTLGNFITDTSMSSQLLVDKNLEILTKLLLKCAREAEKKIITNTNQNMHKPYKKYLNNLWHNIKINNVTHQYKKIHYQ
jgi:hypothetical protein